jgi:HK97 family phage portal protein
LSKLVRYGPEPSKSLVRRWWDTVRSSWSGSYSLKDPELNRLFGTGAGTSAGVTVTLENAFTYSAVYSAVNQIASDVSKMPLNLMKRRPGGGADHYIDSKLYWLLKYQPNPEMGSMVFRRQLMAWALVDKGGFAEIQRDGMGRPVAIWPVAPNRVEVDRPEMRQRDGSVRYGELRYKIDGGPAFIPASDMIHVTGIGYSPHCPYGLIDKARQAIGLGLAAERFGASFFGNGSTFGGLLISDLSLSEEEAKALRDAVERQQVGPDRAHRLGVLWGGLKYQSLGVKPNEAQMNELRDKQIEEVARFFRMPPYMLGLNKPGTVSYASVEMARLDYYTGCLLDWVTLNEQEFVRKLIPASEIRQQYIKHNANMFLRGDIKSRYDALGVARDKGIINADEWRDLEDMNPQDGGQGKLYLVQAAQTPLNLIEEQVKANIEKTKQPPPAPVTPSKTDADVKAADDRAAQAEALVAETRAKLEEQIGARAAAELASVASEAQIAAMVQRERDLVGQLTAQTALAEALRADAVRASDAQREAEIAAAREQEQRQYAELAAEQTRTEAERMVSAALTEAEALAARAAELETAESLARMAREQAEQRATEAAQMADAARAAREQAETAAAEAVASERAQRVAEADAAAGRERDALAVAEQARADVEALRAEVAATQQARQAAAEALVDAESRAATAEAAARTAREEAERRAAEADRVVTMHNASTADAEERAIQAEEARVVAQAEAEAARAQMTLTEASKAAQVQEARNHAEEVLNRAKQAEAEAEAAVKAAKQFIESRSAALMSANRSMVAYTVRRMVDYEVKRLRSAQGSLPKLKTAIASFYADFREVYAEAMTPAMQAHVTWLGSGEDAASRASEMAERHVAESMRQLTVVLSADPEESYRELLDKTLQRWEQGRADAMADAVLQEAIDTFRKAS